jgi:outer membrane protein assembly factor BamB
MRREGSRGERRAWSLAVALVTVNAACTGYRPVPQARPGPPPAPVPLADTPLLRVWRSHPLRGPSHPLATDSANVYLGGSDRHLAAVDLETGRTRWSVRLGGPIVGGVLRDGDLIYAATDQPEGRVHARRAESGSEAWHVSTGYVQHPLVLAGDLIIALTRDGRLYGIDKRNGKVAWKEHLAGGLVPPTVLDSARILVTTFDSLFLVGTRDGRILRRHGAPPGITGRWEPAGHLLATVTGDSLVVALNPDALEVRGQVRLDGPLLTRPALIDDTLYCVTQAGAVWRVQLTDSLRADRVADLHLPVVGGPVILGDWLLLGGADGDLRALQRSSGTVAWHLLIGRPAEHPPLLLRDGDLLALGGRGELQRLRL